MDIVEFAKQYPLRAFKKGEVVMNEGDILDTLLYINSGYIKVTSLDKTGSERMLWIAGPEDLVPSEHLFSRHNELGFFYVALTDVEAYAINKAAFLAYTMQQPALMADIAASMSDHYDDLMLRIDSIGQPSIHEKLIATLRYLARRFSRGTHVDLHRIGLPLTHQDIAEMIGSTRETTSLELQKLRKQQLIHYDRSRFVIHLDRFDASPVRH